MFRINVLDIVRLQQMQQDSEDRHRLVITCY